MGKKQKKTSGKVTKPANRSDAQRVREAFKQGNYDKAIIILQAANGTIGAEQRQAALAESFFRRADKQRHHQPEQATNDLLQAAQVQPNDPVYAYHLALDYHRRKDYEQAISWYRKALQADASYEKAVFPLALALAESGKAVQKDAIWQKLSANQKAYFGDEPAANNRLLLGIEAAKKQQWDVAEKHFQALVDDSSTSASARATAHDYLGRAVLRRDASAVETALQHWRQAYDAGLRSPALIENIGLAFATRIENLLVTEQINAATELAQAANKYAPNHPRLTEIQAYVLLRAGYQAATANDWETALEHWEAITEAEGDIARRLAADMALAYEKLEMWEQAADSWRDFAKRRSHKEGAANWLAPQQVARLWTRISNLYMRVDMEDEAISTLQTALKYEPDSVELGVELGRRYAEAGRVEAAHNQVDRVLKKHPKEIKALVFKAQLSEISPRGWGFVNHEGIKAWKVVLQSNDETYAPIARESLQEMYLEEFEKLMTWGFNNEVAFTLADECLALFPDDHFFRARYVHLLLKAKKKDKEVQAQIDLIDLTDEDALHQLVDAFHIANKPKQVDKLLEQANAKSKLSAQFYSGIAGCAFKRKQFDVAENYFSEALLVGEPEDVKGVLVEKARMYFENEDTKTADTILKEVFKLDASFGPAHLACTVMSMNKGDTKEAKWHLKKAEKWARDEGEPEMLALLEQLRMMIDNPFAGLLPPGFDPSMLDMGFDPDDYFEDDEDDGWGWH